MPALSVSTAPCGVIRPTEFVPTSPNHMFPSGPSVIPLGCAPAGSGYSLTFVVAGSITPIRPRASVNHRRPSGPGVSAFTPWGFGFRRNSVMSPAVVIRPKRFGAIPNHRLPSGPATMPVGMWWISGIGNSVMSPAGVIRPTTDWVWPSAVNHMFPSGPAASQFGASLWIGGPGNGGIR